jgi:hypothetical protein
VNALRYGLQPPCQERSEAIARQRPEAAGCVLRTPGPTPGAMAHRAGAGLRVYQEPHGVEQHFAFFKAPLIVKSLFLKQPERMEALGLG